MCFYYAIVKTNASTLVKEKVIDGTQLDMFKEYHIVSGFGHPVMPVITSEKPGVVQNFHWGYIPGHIRSREQAEQFTKSYNTLNAKGETLFKSRLYAEAAQKRRCLVLCSGFFEWRHQKKAGKAKPEKYPFYITLRNDELFVFGGIWDSFTDKETGEVFNTYSIITTEANPLMSVVHNSKNRMPLIIDPAKAEKWLNPETPREDIVALIKPFDAKKMRANPIRKINPFMLNKSNTPDVIAYYPYPELTEILDPEMFYLNLSDEH
ncbi:MAG: SOS response-associated peptidase [Prolixibacteraceae bacterium]|nr:SOS response-associated peptidase [Prolixibacteraceae bacterium]